MALKVKQTATVVTAANKQALILAGELTAGNLLNDRLAKLVTPKLPFMARAYADTPLGKAVLANTVAAALIHFLPENDKAQIASGMMVQAAMVEFVGEFDIEGMVNEFLDGITLPDVPTPVVNTEGEDETQG